MSQPPVPLLEGEVVLKGDERALYVKSVLGLGYHVLYGRLWLTSARLVHEDLPLGRVTAYPLCRLVSAVNDSVAIAQKKFEIKGLYSSWARYDAALGLEFDNGGLEYFIPQDVEGWAQAIAAAVPSAPALDYTHVPPIRPSLHVDRAAGGPAPTSAPRSGAGRACLIAAILIVVLFTCAGSACVVLPFMAGLLGGAGD